MAPASFREQSGLARAGRDVDAGGVLRFYELLAQLSYPCSSTAQLSLLNPKATSAAHTGGIAMESAFLPRR